VAIEGSEIAVFDNEIRSVLSTLYTSRHMD
jgi:hypothetical protein